MEQKDIVLTILVAIAGMLYLFGIAKAGHFSLHSRFENENKEELMSSSSFLAQAVISIGGIFSVNLGAYLGFSFEDISTNEVGISTIINPFNLFSQGIDQDYFMSLSAWIYLLGLLSAMILWGFKNFNEDPIHVVPLLPSLSRTFLGVLVGAVLFVLTRP